MEAYQIKFERVLNSHIRMGSSYPVPERETTAQKWNNLASRF